MQLGFLVDFLPPFSRSFSSLYVICKTIPRYVIAEMFLVLFYFFVFNFRLTESYQRESLEFKREIKYKSFFLYYKNICVIC